MRWFFLSSSVRAAVFTRLSLGSDLELQSSNAAPQSSQAAPFLGAVEWVDNLGVEILP